MFDGIPQRHVAGNGHDRNAAFGNRGLYGDLKDAGHLLGLRDEFTVLTALAEKVFRMRFLKIPASDFTTWNLRSDRENGNTAAMTIVETVDQMHVARATTSGAHGELAGQVRFGACGERRGFLVPYADPGNAFTTSKRVGDSIQRIPCDAINSLDVRFFEHIDKQFGDAGLAAAQFSPLFNEAESVAIQPDGRIVAAGFTVPQGQNGARNMAIARFNPNGSLDHSFGSNGTVQLVVAGSSSCAAGVVLLQPDGKMLVGGSANFPSGPSGVAVRLGQNGAIDTTFGNSGVAKTGAVSGVNGLGLQHDGKIVVLGDSSAVRLLANGTVDTQRTRGSLVAEAHSGTSMLSQNEKIIRRLQYS